MRFSTALSTLCLVTLAAAVPLKSRDTSSSWADSAEDTIGSITGTGSGNEAGNSNDAGATGNGNGNTGATAGASNFLNGASASDNGVGDGNTGNTLINLRRKREDAPTTSDSNVIGSVVDTGSEDVAGIGNTATASGNGNGNTGSSASAGDFLNGSSASDNGAGDGNDDNSAVSFRKRDDSASPADIIGSVVGTGSGNEAGNGNSASAGDNGNGNTGASASSGNFLNGASATDNGVGDGNDGNSVVSLRRRIAVLESALERVQKRSICESSTIGSVTSTGASNVAGVADSASAISNDDSNTGATASASNFLNGASANDNGVLDGNDNDTLVDLTLPSTVNVL